MELGRNEILPSERKHLAVKIVHRGGYEQQPAEPPTPIRLNHNLLFIEVPQVLNFLGCEAFRS